MVWLLFGTAVHSVLENQQEAESELKEERLKVKIGDYTLSGKADLYCANKKKITDYKTTSAWKVVHEDYKDWRTQLLMYGYMWREHGFPVGMGEIVAFLKDHSKSKAKYDKAYPQFPVQTVRFSFSEKDFASTHDLLIAKFAEIACAEQLPDDELPLCTLEERFNDGDKFAVMKKGNKKALRVVDSMEEAEAWIKKNGKGDSIEARPGCDRKCESYCFANEFCSYWQEQKGVQEQGQLIERGA
jgi:hypothetical protein